LTEITYSLEDIDPIELFGVGNSKIQILKDAFPGVKFVARGSDLKILGDSESLTRLSPILEKILEELTESGSMDVYRLEELILSNSIKETEPELPQNAKKNPGNLILHGINGMEIYAKTPGQVEMLESAVKNEILFAIGPAGTGKTYTAVAIAVRSLKEKKVKKIVLVRPAVEAGESLGFLPGDLKEKIDPYLRPLYDALGDMIPPERLKSNLEKNIIEIVPLAFMRGRTLNNAFIILDEAQNATEMQMKMLLTRLGMESRIIVTGDVTQIDLPRTQKSGLIQGINLLKNIKGISFVRLTQQDVVRHPLVKKILAAYEKIEEGKQ
jgi:phosphate starvation-inducible PhoH-like protein